MLINIVAMVTAMDDAVGSIVPALMQKGIYDNTLIVFLSDVSAVTVMLIPYF